VYGVRTGNLCGGDDSIGLKVAVFGGAGSNAHGAIGQFQVFRPTIFLRKNTHRFHVELAAGAKDA
jgi:hypothetical protein